MMFMRRFILKLSNLSKFLKMGNESKVVKCLPKDHVPIVEEGNDVPVNPPEMTSGEIKEAFLILARDLTTHMNRCIERRVNIVERTMTLRLRDFVRIHPPIFLGPKVGENPQ